jgi:hypothetical protein
MKRRRHLENFSSIFPEINFVFARSIQFHKRLLKLKYHPTKSEGRMKAAVPKRSYRQCHLWWNDDIEGRIVDTVLVVLFRNHETSNLDKLSSHDCTLILEDLHSHFGSRYSPVTSTLAQDLFLRPPVTYHTIFWVTMHMDVAALNSFMYTTEILRLHLIFSHHIFK